MTLEHRLARAFLAEHPSDAARALERVPIAERASVLRAAPVDAARALSQMVTAAAADSLSSLTPDEAAPVLNALPLDTAILVLRRVPTEAVEGLIGQLPKDKQEWLRRALQYPEGTAGALMDPAVMALPDDISVAEARIRLRRRASGLLYYLFVVDRTGRLVGVLDIAELMRAHAREPLTSVMHQQVDHLPAWTPANAVRRHPAWRRLHAMPVTDDGGRLVGAIRYQMLRRLEQEAEGVDATNLTTVTVGALGELFHLGMAGMVEGLATAATPRTTRLATGGSTGDRGTP